MKPQKKWLFYPLAGLVGVLNGLFGAGGGVVAVPLLRGMGLSENEAHATSISITLPLAVLSGYFYLTAAHFTLGEAVPYLPGALAGAVLGGWLLPRMSTLWLRRIFGAVIVFSAIRLLMR